MIDSHAGRGLGERLSLLGQRFGVPRTMLWTGLLVCGALCLLFWIVRAEVVQGQLMDVPAVFLLVVALLLGTAFQGTRACRRIAEVAARPRSLLLVSVTVFVVLALGTLLVFGTSPLSGDEQTHLFQARLFAQFRITASYAPELLDRTIAPGYQNDLILVGSDGRAMSVYWPGWALLMTPFVWLGVPWLLGPATAALGVYVMGRLASLLAGANTAAIAILLAVTSGSFLVTRV